MKKLLALVLALVMTMSLVTISNAAFKDADQISNKEAVEVMNLVGVIAGYDNGDFGAKDTLTRAQAAKIVAYLDLGKATADAIVGTGKVFSDVKATAWYAGFVEYCAGAGYVAGIGDGKFAPDEKVTGVQFAKMLLCALGYKAEVEGYTGGDYTINIARDANKNDLYKDTNASAIGALTREQAAQMAFNTLKATVVEYQGGTNVSTSDGTKVTVNAVRNEVANKSYSYVAGDATYSATGTQQLCEKLYGKDLKLNSTTDGMQRAAHQWNYKGTDSAKYADSADYTEIVKKSGKTVASYVTDVMKKTFTYAATPATVNGGTAAESAVTLNVGDKVEFFMNSADVKKVDKVVITRYDGTFTVGAAPEVRTNNNEEQVTISNAPFSWIKTSKVNGYEGLVKDDVVAYYSDSNGDYYLTKTTAVEGKLTEIKSGSPAKYVIGGTEYMASLNAPSNFNDTYKYFLDDNGFIVAEKLVEAEKSDFVVVQDFGVANNGGGVGGSAYVNARIVKMDGTTEIVKIKSVKEADGTLKKGDSANSGSGTLFDSSVPSVTVTAAANFYTYTINSDGEYELTAITGSDYKANTAFSGATIKKDITSFGSYFVNDSTVFVVAKASSGDDNTKYVVYTGKGNVPTVGNASSASGTVITDKNGVAKYVFVKGYTGASVSSGKTVLFLKDTYESKIVEKINGSDVTSYTYKVIEDTTLTTVKITGITSVTPANALYTPNYDSNGMISALNDPTTNAARVKTYSTTSSVEATIKLSGGTLVVTDASNSDAFVCAADAKVVVKDINGDFYETTAANYSYSKNAVTLDITVVLTSDATDNTVQYVFVAETKK